ncbi:MAG: hypothetical protein IPK76_14985 [Lewinellaceae bacterium]|nr:hypothetical protein [Lewinellaceae bacterium]
MSTSTWIILGVVALLVFLYFKFKGAQGVPLLKASVGTTDDVIYNVQFEPIHPDIKQIEYVRMILHFTTKILFVVEPNKHYLKTR